MKILIISPIHDETVHELGRYHDVVCAYGAEREELKSRIRDREALIFRSGVKVDRELLSEAKELRILIRAGCGLDNLDVDYVDSRGLRLYRIRKPAADAVSELGFALMLCLARQVCKADASMQRGEWAKYHLKGRLLSGKTLGIVGAGNIGARLGELGAAWGMQPIGCVESPSPHIAAQLRRQGITLSTFEEVLSQSDFVNVTVPLQESTKGLIDASALSRMKADAFLVNLSRGGVVDEEALYEHLVAGRLGGAALDVHQKEGAGGGSPLAGLENVILTPHIGSMTAETQVRIGAEIRQIVDMYSGAEQQRSAM